MVVPIEYDRQIWEFIQNPQGTENALRARCRLFLRTLRLQWENRLSVPAWSRARKMYGLLKDQCKWCTYSLVQFFEHGDPNSQLRGDIQKLAKLADPSLQSDLRDEGLLVRIRLPSKRAKAGRVRQVSPMMTKSAMEFSLLGASFQPRKLVAVLSSRRTLPQNEAAFVTYCCVGIMTHYFPIRQQTVAELKKGDLLSAEKRDGWFVMRMRSTKVGKHMHRAFPDWFGELLMLYLDKVRPIVENGDNDILFIHPASKRPFNSTSNTIGNFLSGSYGELFPGGDYVASNMKRKVLETATNISVYKDRSISNGLEHNRQAGSSHYNLETPTSAILLAKLYIRGYKELCGSEGYTIPKEFERMIRNISLH